MNIKVSSSKKKVECCDGCIHLVSDCSECDFYKGRNGYDRRIKENTSHKKPKWCKVVEYEIMTVEQESE